MRKETNLTVGRWCDRWFCENLGRWSGSTVGGYRNLIYRHILPEIGSIPLAELSENAVTSFYDGLRSQDFSARSVWCIHLLLWRCIDERPVSSASLIIRRGSAGNHSQTNPLCDWGSSSGI